MFERFKQGAGAPRGGGRHPGGADHAEDDADGGRRGAESVLHGDDRGRDAPVREGRGGGREGLTDRDRGPRDADDRDRVEGRGDRGLSEHDRGDRRDRDRDRGRPSGARHREGSGGGLHQRQREQFGGFKVGAAFFGWLVAIGLAALLTALAAAAGAAVGLSQTGGSAPTSPPPSAGSIGTVDIIGAVVVGLVLFLAYLCGGYVAGRMARFDGARQGLGVWLIGIVIAIVLAVLAAILGSEFNVLAQLNLPRIPIDEGSLATGGLIALGAWLLVTLLGAILGGKLGERYHRKVDRVGVDRPGPGR